MKKKLLLLLCLVLTGIGQMRADWTQGVTVQEGNDYFLYNLGGKKFLTEGMDWGTHATLDNAGRLVDFALVDGKYRLWSHTYGSNDKAGFVCNEGYVDEANVNAERVALWQFESVEVDGYTNVYTLKCADDKYLVYNNSDCRVNVTASSNDAYSYWVIIPKASRDEVNDVTYYLKNTDFNRPWERPVWEASFSDNPNGSSACSIKAFGGTNYCTEVWNGNFNISQTVSNIPNGKYRIDCQGWYRPGGHGATGDEKNAILFANSSEKGLMNINEGAASEHGNGCYYEVNGKYVPQWLADVSEIVNNEIYYINDIEAFVTNGTLKLGIKKETKIDNDWTIFDNIHLTYVRPILATSTKLNAGSSVAADGLYFYDIPTNGDFKIISSVDATLSYTQQDETTDLDEAVFTDVSLTANTPQTISLTQGRVFLKMSAAGSLNIAPASFGSGTFYVYNAKTNKFLSRGKNWGTAATVDEYGVPVIVDLTATGTTIKYVDTQDKSLYGNDWAWTDGTAKSYIVTGDTQGYVLTCDRGKMYVYVVGDEEARFNCVANNGTLNSNYFDEAYALWQIKTREEHDAIVASNRLADHKAIVAAAGGDAGAITSDADFNNWLATRLSIDATSNVTNAALSANIDGWDQVNVRRYEDSTHKNEAWYTTKDGCTEMYRCANSLTQTVSNLTPGVYKVTLNGFFRQGTNANCVTYADYDLSNAYIQANDYKENLATWASDRSADDAPNSRSAATALFAQGKYLNTLYTVVGQDGQLVLTISNPNYANNTEWMCFNNLTLTYLEEVVKGTDCTSIIKDADCTVNDGWPGLGRYTTTMEAYNAENRVVFSSNTNAGIDGNGQRSQTIVLPVSGAYKLTTYCKISAATGYVTMKVDNTKNSTTNDVARKLNVVNTDGTVSNTLNTDGTGWVANEIYFTGNTGDSKTIDMNISWSDGGAHTSYAFVSGVKLTYLGETGTVVMNENNPLPAVQTDMTCNVTIARALNNTDYAPLCLPFAYTPENWQVYELTDQKQNGENVSLTLTEVSEMVAGKPYIVKPNAAVTEITANDVTLIAAPVTIEGEYVNMIGNFAPTTLRAGDYYVATGSQIKHLTATTANMKGFRAYFQEKTAGARSLNFSFGDDETAIGVIDALTSGKAEIYDLNGRKLNSLQKGINIINGKKVMVK